MDKIRFQQAENGLYYAVEDDKIVGYVKEGIPTVRFDSADNINSVGVIVVKDGEILVGARQKGSDTGMICGPGGHIEEGEDPEEAAIRETKEEFGITPKDLIPIGTVPAGDNERTKGGESEIFLTDEFEGDIFNTDHELVGSTFMTLYDLLNMKCALFKPFLSSLDLLCGIIDEEQEESPLLPAFEALSDDELKFIADEIGIDADEILELPDGLLLMIYGMLCDSDYNTDDDDNDWITINGTHICLNKEGIVIGGAGGIFNGQAYTAEKRQKAAVTRATNPKRIASICESIAQKAQEAADKGEKMKEPVIDTPETRDFLKRVDAGETFTAKDLEGSPVMSQLDAISAYWDKKYGDTSDITTKEREDQRKDWVDDFLKTPPMKLVTDDDGHPLDKNGKVISDDDPDKEKKYRYEEGGEIQKGYEAEVVIGLPASGKSSSIVNGDSAKKGAFILDSDELKPKIPEFQNSGGGAANAVHNESKDMNKAAMNAFTTGDRNGDNLVIPIIGDDYSKVISKYIEPLESAGYKVNIKYKSTDPDQSLTRNVKRAIDSGRIINSKIALGYGNKPDDVYNQFVADGRWQCEKVD